jgi:hypothetical protein
MTRRPGQSGTVVRKGRMWYSRYYEDVPEQEQRKRLSVPLGHGVPDELVREWVGHSSARTTARYTHFQDDFRQ